MQRISLILLTLSLLTLTAPLTDARGESLFDPIAADLFTDFTAKHVGDSLTILISESTKGSRSVKTNVKKEPKETGQAKVEGFFDVLTGLNSVIEPLKNLNIDPKEDFQSQASTTADGTFTGRLTVLVKEVLPNGNLVIEGKRYLTINREKETLSITGTVRPWDITPDNTILSTQVADVEIGYTGKGVVSRSQKNGFFSKLFNLIF